jgi:hypothetical protein
MDPLSLNAKPLFPSSRISANARAVSPERGSVDLSIQEINRLIQSPPPSDTISAGLPPLDAFPVYEGWGLLVSVEGVEFEYQFTREDLQKVFQRYGRLSGADTLSPQFPFGRVWFLNRVDAERAIQDLDHKVLNSIHGRLRVVWDPNSIRRMQESQTAADLGPLPSSFPQPPTPQSSRKLTCRFDIGIDNDKEFQVARRIIGQKGANMKKIVEATGAKLRLRGKGSGYLEGPLKEESQEPLHLCVSCTSMKGYNDAVQAVTEILEGVYLEYKKFRKSRRLPELQDLKVVMKDTTLAGTDRASTPPQDEYDSPSSPEHSIPPERRYDSGYWKVPS